MPPDQFHSAKSLAYLRKAEDKPVKRRCFELEQTANPVTGLTNGGPILIVKEEFIDREYRARLIDPTLVELRFSSLRNLLPRLKH